MTTLCELRAVGQRGRAGAEAQPRGQRGRGGRIGAGGLDVGPGEDAVAGHGALELDGAHQVAVDDRAGRDRAAVVAPEEELRLGAAHLGKNGLGKDGQKEARQQGCPREKRFH